MSCFDVRDKYTNIPVPDRVMISMAEKDVSKVENSSGWEKNSNQLKEEKNTMYTSNDASHHAQGDQQRAR